MSALEQLEAKFFEINALRKSIAWMTWDQQVLMPPGAASARAEHVTRMDAMAHALTVADETLRTLEDASREAESDDEVALIRVARREVDYHTKLPADLVSRKAALSSEAYNAWKRARPANDFKTMTPYYREHFEIAREISELLGYDEHPYDPLIDLYEEGATYAVARKMFDTIKEPISALVREIRDRGRPIDDSAMVGAWDNEALLAAARDMAATIGYDFERGRLDIAANAFCTNFSVDDVRMTTRPSEHLKGILSSSLHEMGHGLYEQRSPREWDRTMLAGGISLAVHESQSRLWENIVGRSRGFWSHFLPSLKQRLPQIETMTVDDFYRGFNKVQATPIRVGADELTYNLHILIRFELEVELVTKRLAVEDLPEAWNAKYESYLGLTPDSDTVGVLQDVHWSKGSCGYFPTYAMGNLIGGQIWKTLRADLGDVDAQMERGDFAPILGWLTEKVYRQGKRFTPAELVRRITGRPMEAGDWLEYADAKYRAIYEL